MIRATIEGDRFRCGDIEAGSLSALCRALLAAGYEGHHPVTAYRGEVPALLARSIAGAARLTVTEPNNGSPRFVPWSPDTRWAR